MSQTEVTYSALIGALYDGPAEGMTVKDLHAIFTHGNVVALAAVERAVRLLDLIGALTLGTDGKVRRAHRNAAEAKGVEFPGLGTHLQYRAGDK